MSRLSDALPKYIIAIPPGTYRHANSTLFSTQKGQGFRFNLLGDSTVLECSVCTIDDYPSGIDPDCIRSEWLPSGVLLSIYSEYNDRRYDLFGLYSSAQFVI